jgi:hypothetical protein
VKRAVGGVVEATSEALDSREWRGSVGMDRLRVANGAHDAVVVVVCIITGVLGVLARPGANPDENRCLVRQRVV